MGEDESLPCLRDIHRGKLKVLQTAERARKKRKYKAKERASFISNPSKFTSKLLGEERAGKLTSSKEEVEEFLTAAHTDPMRHDQLGDCKRILPADQPSALFKDSEPTWREVADVVKKARAGSAPGPNGVPYRVYKNCPKLLKRLWSLLKVV